MSVSQERFAFDALSDGAALLLLRERGWAVYRPVPLAGDLDPLPSSSDCYFAARRSDGRTLRGQSPLDLVRRIGEATEIAAPCGFEQDDVDELEEAA